MSVLIKGMEMPKTCAACPCLRHDSLDGEHAYQCNVTFGLRKNIDRKPKWCPLVALPEKHGRLIDADEIYFSMTDGIDQDIAEEAIRETPTVIEAEGEDRLRSVIQDMGDEG